ncbi:hypothetical protein K469DRAFT_724582 [Zopfia rhizophila CBS 207.26]|uniref:Uncharacterized protein n=1 Tax=Zopfia rhizophila CBS 207.26 TaxID=1314779 RepID=A0A6A6EBY5_9PEZI|nr:hypothetical protein K469DRAFT_724582 [Zopfia rhizophila CBS 207.26]
MSNISFFSFGPEDSFISKSFEGLRYRNLPRALQKLILPERLAEAYWAVLGPRRESWVITYKDLQGRTRLDHGSDIPGPLRTFLRNVTPSSHLRIFFGPVSPNSVHGSPSHEPFIAWDATSIRWASLPDHLEGIIQSWLSPAGWKAGPPRFVTLGKQNAFFAMTEYGEVEYYHGYSEAPLDHKWPIYEETVEDWTSEAGFDWSNLAYISLDPTTTDQFIAIRHDGTWAGSIDDSKKEALEAFALNFFSLAKPKPKSKSKSKSKSRSPPNNSHSNHQRQTNGIPTPDKPDPTAQALYKAWSTEVATSFAAASSAHGGKAPKKLQIRNPKANGPATQSIIPTSTSAANSRRPKLLSKFPYLPAALTTCALAQCIATKSEADGLRACRHDVEKLLRASGLYSYEWLRQERLRWHPDRFGRLCEESWRETGRKLAEEMWKIIDELITEMEKQKENEEGRGL